MILVAAAGAVGALLAGFFTGDFITAVAGAIISAVVYFIGWYIWSYAVLVVGTKLFGGTADFGEVSRCIAYAYTPNMLRIFGFVPVVGGLLMACRQYLVAGRRHCRYPPGHGLRHRQGYYHCGHQLGYSCRWSLPWLRLLLLAPLGIASMLTG